MHLSQHLRSKARSGGNDTSAGYRNLTDKFYILSFRNHRQ